MRTVRERKTPQQPQKDNSGRANIFGVEPRTLYTSSPTSEKAARQGLGGAQGIAVLLVALAAVSLVTLGIFKQGNPSSLTEATKAAEQAPSLNSLSTNIKGSL
ncbi:hypothetical protein WJX81_001096 [Elliptochloris bilobata]|uniref:Uncharacterized protein n=1 Tax=Elliptochloris bilobata TaxID=381761 RepID=A0AAW1RYI7_9CHLO